MQENKISALLLEIVGQWESAKATKALESGLACAVRVSFLNFYRIRSTIFAFFMKKQQRVSYIFEQRKDNKSKSDKRE